MSKDSTELKWRDLALQFDGHRMQSLCFLKQILDALPETEFPEAREFLKAGPIPGEEVLRQRLADMVKSSKKIRFQKTLGITSDTRVNDESDV